MNTQLFLAAALLLQHSIAVESMGTLGDGDGIRKRRLSSFANYFFGSSASVPNVDRCWTDMQVLGPTGEEHPVLGCDFVLPTRCVYVHFAKATP